jgi:hypothetical protein
MSKLLKGAALVMAAVPLVSGASCLMAPDTTAAEVFLSKTLYFVVLSSEFFILLII